MDLTISIVSTQDVSALKKCLAAIRSNMDARISYEVHVVNNASGPMISEMVTGSFPGVILTENHISRGFAENHNDVIRKSKGDAVLIMNNDIYAEPGFFNGLLTVLRKDQKTGIVMGKLLCPGEGCRTIDSTGIILLRSRRTLDRGQGELDKGQYGKEGEIFSASGAAMLCRRSMLEDIALLDDYFDRTYKLYKEDLDLSWRARLRGWKVMYTPSAVATHDRGWGPARKRSSVQRWIRRESYKNRYFTIIKNDHLRNILMDLPFILFHEIKALIYVIFREPHLMLAWGSIFVSMPSLLKKRHVIQKNAKVSAKDIRYWIEKRD